VRAGTAPLGIDVKPMTASTPGGITTPAPAAPAPTSDNRR
jgi:hypothetical protein